MFKTCMQLPTYHSFVQTTKGPKEDYFYPSPERRGTDLNPLLHEFFLSSVLEREPKISSTDS